MPKRKISSGPQPMDCSDGAKMLIDQMKANPEEFRGYASKFRDVLEAAQRTLHQPATASVAYQMSLRDAKAIMAAAEEHLFEVWLAEDVLTRMMAPKEAPGQYQEAMRIGASGNMGLGTVDPRRLYVQNTTSNTITAQYDQAYQMSLAKHKMELEKIRREEEKHAMRNTKPFKSSI